VFPPSETRVQGLGPQWIFYQPLLVSRRDRDHPLLAQRSHRAASVDCYLPPWLCAGAASGAGGTSCPPKVHRQPTHAEALAPEIERKQLHPNPTLNPTPDTRNPVPFGYRVPTATSSPPKPRALHPKPRPYTTNREESGRGSHRSTRATIVASATF
jgi:hypothetical protein